MTRISSTGDSLTPFGERPVLRLLREYIEKKYVRKAWAPRDIPPPHIGLKKQKNKSVKDNVICDDSEEAPRERKVSCLSCVLKNATDDGSLAHLLDNALNIEEQEKDLEDWIRDKR